MLLNLYFKGPGKKKQLYPTYIILPGGKAARTRAEEAPDSKLYLLSIVEIKKNKKNTNISGSL